MPDSPDYSKYLGGSVRFSLQDMGELAARLGSPGIYDRRGEFVWYDKFDRGLSAWEKLTIGTGGDISLVADSPHLGNYAAKLTAGSTSSKSANMSRVVAFMDFTKIGVEVSWSHNSNVANFDVIFIVVDDAKLKQAWVRFDTENQLLKYVNSSGTFSTLGALKMRASTTPTYRNVKVVMDIQNETYDRILCNTDAFENLAIPIFTSANSGEDYMSLAILVNSKTAVNGVAHVGQVIITGNEP
jgi:hypothetical protein